jgi:hypothetical protein
VWLRTVAGGALVSANILVSVEREFGDSMSDGLKAMRDAAPLMPLSARPPRERPNRDIIAFAALRRTSASSASGGFDTRLSRHEGHCLDSRSCSDLASGGDLSKGHPNYQTSTRGQTMQQVVTRGRGGNGGARCCGPRFAWAKAPMRLARTPGHASRKALTRRFPLACHGDRQHRFPQDLGTSGRRRGPRRAHKRMGTSVSPTARFLYDDPGARFRYDVSTLRRCCRPHDVGVAPQYPLASWSVVGQGRTWPTRAIPGGPR